MPVEFDPFGRPSQIVGIERPSDHAHLGAHRDGDHLGGSDLGAAGNLHPNIVPGAALLRDEDGKRQPGPLRAQIRHFKGAPDPQLRLRSRHLTSHDFRSAASQAFRQLLSREDSCNCVIALPPSGLLGGYWKVVNETRGAVIVVLRDAPENILERITFYDIDSRPVQKNLTDREKASTFGE